MERMDLMESIDPVELKEWYQLNWWNQWNWLYVHDALGMPRDTISAFFFIVSKAINPPGTGKEAANVNGFYLRFYERDLAPLFQPLSALSLKETNLSGCSWFQKISEKPS